MTLGAGDPLEETTPSPEKRARMRLGVLLVSAGVLLLPWHGSARGIERAGAAAAAALLASWGLAATSLLAQRRRGLRIGEAATSAAIAGLLLALVASRHPWLPGPDRRATWVPIFGPLTLLAAIDLLALVRRVPVGAAVAGIRAAAAAIACAALLVGRQGFPAGVAAFLWAGPALTAFVPRARGARRGLEILAMAAAFALLLAPEIQQGLAPTRDGEVDTIWAFLHRVLAVILWIAAFRGVLLPEPHDTAAPA